MITLYDYPRSTASYRVRIALRYKNLDYQSIPVHLVNNGGEQHSADYQRINPQQLIPALVDNEQILTQSLAIIEYLEVTYPEPALLPTEPRACAEVRSLAQMIACDIHPLNNLRVLQYLEGTLQITADQKQAWYHHWLRLGFDAIEARLRRRPTAWLFCMGDTPTLADVCLIPQLYNAHRYEFVLTDYPLLSAIERHCLSLPAFEPGF